MMKAIDQYGKLKDDEKIMQACLKGAEQEESL